MVMPAKTAQTASTALAARTAKPTAVPSPLAADPEVGAPQRRRTFSARDKLRILAETEQAAASGEPGAIGVVLRREGIYSSMLGEWRRQRDAGALEGLAPRQRGPKPEPVNPHNEENIRLRRENAAMKERLIRAEQIIELQKKLSEMLAVPLKTLDSDGSV